MNKKISEMMDHLDEQYIQGIQIEDREKVDIDKDKEGIEYPSLYIIKRKALEGIKVVPLETVKEQKKEKKHKLTGKKRFILPLVAALTALGMTVVAVSNYPVLSHLIGDGFGAISKEAQVVGQSVTKQGITFTVEEAVIDSSSGFIAVSFTKEDGSPFEPGTMPERISIQPKHQTSMGYSYEPILSEDGKKIFCLIDMSMSGNLYGQEITLLVEKIGRTETGEIPLELNLQDAYNQMQGLDYHFYEGLEYTPNQALGIPLTDTLPGLVLDQVILDHKGILKLYTSYEDPYEENNLNTTFKLIDTALDSEVYYQEGTNIWDASTKRRKIEDVYRGVVEEDLKDLKLTLQYEKYIPLAGDEWALTFKLQKNKNVKKAKPNLTLTKGTSAELVIKEVEVSRLGVRVEGYQPKGSVALFDMSLKMKDGKRIGLSTSGLNTKSNYFFIQHLEAAVPDEETVVPPTENTVPIDSVTYPIGFSLQHFIDLDQVESLIIEDTEIPVS